MDMVDDSFGTDGGWTSWFSLLFWSSSSAGTSNAVTYRALSWQVCFPGEHLNTHCVPLFSAFFDLIRTL